MAEQAQNTIIAGKYRLLSILGRGAMGEVYRAVQLDVEGHSLREVTLKMIRAELSCDDQYVQRFLREIRIAILLQNEHVVRVYDSGRTEEGQLYFTMELVRGKTLNEVLRQHGALPIERIVRIVGQVCDALDEAHHLPRPIVHRDLKPANIFVADHARKGEVIKLGDFGIAKVTGELTTGFPALTDPNRGSPSPGTPVYMAPEQCGGKDPDGRTDLYALGIITYEMLAGRRPFQGDRNALMYQHIHTVPPPLPASIPNDIRRLVEQLLAKDPKERPASSLIVKQALETAWEQAQRFGEQDTVLQEPKEHCSPQPTETPRSQPSEARKETPQQPTPPQATPPPAAAKPPRQEKRQEQLAEQVPKDKAPRPTEPLPQKSKRPWWVYGTGAGLVVLVVAFFIPRLWPPEFPQEEKQVVQQPPSEPAPPPQEAVVTPPKQEQKAQVEPPKEIKGQDGKEMVLIPAGQFLMGCNETVDQQCDGDEKPSKEVYLDAFYIDKYEVTPTEYRRCVEAGKCSTQDLTPLVSCNWNEADRANHPINCVDWNQAQAYCEWAGKRLPTEAEWEKAARGIDGRVYPWGNEWDEAKANIGSGGTTPVGSYRGGVSPYGVFDMSGNVWEWVQDWYDVDYYKGSPDRNPRGLSEGNGRVLRGGSWSTYPRRTRVFYRYWSDPGHRSDSLGFRCAQ